VQEIKLENLRYNGEKMKGSQGGMGSPDKIIFKMKPQIKKKYTHFTPPDPTAGIG